jgi:Na+-transporting methylmalonyl-CoA/oxaloacetate decarboxylase beta subunit
MNLLAVVIGCITSTTIAFALGLYGYQATIIASIIGIAAGHATAWTINKLAPREIKMGRYSYLTQAPPQIPHMIEAVTEDGVLYYRIYLKTQGGSIDQIKLPANLVSLRATNGSLDAVFFERFFCIKNKLLALLAFTRNEFVDYQVIAPYDKLP